MKSGFHHFIAHAQKYGNQHRSLYALSIMILFWTMFDTVVTYVTPLILTEHGLSNTIMGIIIGSSSVFGALFDLIITKIAPQATFRRLFLAMFAICLVYPLILWQAKSIWMFLLAMALWGVYYDLVNFGKFNFIGRFQKESEHSSSFGVTEVFRAIGVSLAPVFVGITIVSVVTWQSFVLSWIFLGIGVIFYLLLATITRKQNPIIKFEEKKQILRPRTNYRLLWKIGKTMLPVLIATFVLYSIEGFYWTVGPLFAEDAFLGGPYAGLFLTAFGIPPLFTGWFVGSITKRFHKKRTAFFSLLIGSSLIALFAFIPTPFLTIPLNFIVGIFIALSYPALGGAFADYVAERPGVEKDIIALEDMATNAGYVIGPMIAGMLADMVGFANAFTAVGVCGAVVAIFLIWKTPKNITIPAR
ncbi:MAG: MFS transporter [Patescibacteria group bacterium]